MFIIEALIKQMFNISLVKQSISPSPMELFYRRIIEDVIKKYFNNSPAVQLSNSPTVQYLCYASYKPVFYFISI